LQLLVGDFGQFREVAQQPNFERTVSMNWNRQGDDTPSLAIDVVAAADAEQSLAAPLDQASKVATG
jgi:hypothetical protein